MYAPERTATTIAVTSATTMGADAGGRISKVLVLNGDADSALASFLSKIEMVAESDDMYLARNDFQALLDLRKAAYGY